MNYVMLSMIVVYTTIHKLTLTELILWISFMTKALHQYIGFHWAEKPASI